MDYVIGSVAALVSGNVTPNRPKLLRRALTPLKQQPSPQVTPKSEIVEDRSIFLSPTLQKKKAIIKKSPKRIFQNPDLDITEEEGNKSLSSPQAEKVKKHLKDELEDSNEMKVPKSSSKKKRNNSIQIETMETLQNANENTPTKKKKQKNSVSEETTTQANTKSSSVSEETKSPSKVQKKRKSISFSEEPKDLEGTSNVQISTDNGLSAKKKRKNKKKMQKSTESLTTSDIVSNEPNGTSEVIETKENQSPKTKKKRNKKKSKQNDTPKETDSLASRIKQLDNTNQSEDTENTPNPNAITDKDSDSEHESDNEDIDSESEINNKQILNSNENEESSDEEEEPPKPQKQKQTSTSDDKQNEPMTDDEIKRTLFVGNVPMSGGVKKKLKRIFSQHGAIETVRIRSIPVKDASATPKLAAIKNELHPDRTTVNVYIKYKDIESVQKALSENNTVLENCHLRVTRSDINALDHDPAKAIFVGNLPFTIEDEELRAKFERCGEIESIRVVRDRKTKAGKGFGFINFQSKDGVELALALTEEDLTVKNRILRLKRVSLQKPPRNNQNQGKFQQRQGKFQPRQGEFQPRQGKFQPRQGNCQQRQGEFQPQQGKFQQRPGRPDQQSKFYKKPGNFNKNQQEDDPKVKNQQAAIKRLEKKRKIQDNGPSAGPPNKMSRPLNQPSKEKKQKKEFVGVTAEKKKKRKFDKGQKKKKALSEILTK